MAIVGVGKDRDSERWHPGSLSTPDFRKGVEFDQKPPEEGETIATMVQYSEVIPESILKKLEEKGEYTQHA